MLRIGICDDDRASRERLRAELERLLQIVQEQGPIYEFSSGAGLLRWLENNRGGLDLVFLDIEMDGLNGMETARRLRANDNGIQLVFVTGYSEYVYDGYEVGALGYLLKPADGEKLADILRRGQKALFCHVPEAFVCRCGESSHRILRQDIVYFASDRRQVQCATLQQDYWFYGKLDEVERQLQDQNFVRIHQRYLIHARFVERMDTGSVIMRGGLALPISRSCRDIAMAALTRAMLT